MTWAAWVAVGIAVATALFNAGSLWRLVVGLATYQRASDERIGRVEDKLDLMAERLARMEGGVERDRIHTPPLGRRIR